MDSRAKRDHIQSCLEKGGNLCLTAGKQIVEGFFYLSHFLVKFRKKLAFKPSLIFLVAGFFILISIVETFAGNDFRGNFISELTDKNGMFIETDIPSSGEKNISPDFQTAVLEREESDEPIEVVGSLGALVMPESTLDLNFPQTRTEIETYVVRPGDVVSSIAENFGLNWSTILWANNLTYWSLIKPGDELKIPPVDGIIYKVKKGENLSSIAQKYKASLEGILDFNGLAENSILEPDTLLVIPNGTPPPPPPAPKYQPAQPVFVQENYSGYLDWRRNTQCHRFVIRQCTDWAAFKWASEQGQCVPSWSHAKYWWNNAAKDDYARGSLPQKGAIMVMNCTSWLCRLYGHVAYVESFDAASVTISEMNGLNSQAFSQRTLENKTNVWQGAWYIVGYIYPR